MYAINDDVDTITDDLIAGLPAPVRRYMRHAGVVGQPRIKTVYLKYKGQFRLGADKPWMPMQADQVYRVESPGFQWKATFKMFGLPLLTGVDTYSDGEGRMFGKMAGLFTVFDASGDELLQGTMLRYLQEMMWFPTAYLEPYITWDAVDDHAADVTFTHDGKQVTGRFYFDDEGRILSFIAERYAEKNGTYALETWATPVTEYATFNGLNIPCVGHGVWYMPEGDLDYVNLRLTQVDYNVPIPAF